MVRVALVDSQCDCDVLLNTLSPLLQIVLDPLHFLFQSSRGLLQFGGFLRILCAGEIDLPPKFHRGLEQFLHRPFGSLNFINRTFHIRCWLSIISRRSPAKLSLCILCFRPRRIVHGRCLPNHGS